MHISENLVFAEFVSAKEPAMENCLELEKQAGKHMLWKEVFEW